MDNSAFTSYHIEDRSFVAYIKREIHNLVKDHFSVKRTGEIDIIVSELTSNIVKHATKGELLYRFFLTETHPVFELLALDNGPGIKDVSAMMKDGISSTNTLGQGLGAIFRLSNFAQIYSLPGMGTVTYAHVCSENAEDLPNDQDKKLQINALSIPKPGETVCGDGFFVKKEGLRTKIFLGDGLGHGELAHEAVQKAISSFKANIRENDPNQLLRLIHNDVRKTRGLVASVAILDTKDKTLKICGVGNIMVRLYTGIVQKTSMTYNGIVGLNIPTTLGNTVTELEKNQTIILCSDGITTRWDISKYPGILKYDPLIIASVLYRDHGRKTDDMSVLVAKVR